MKLQEFLVYFYDKYGAINNPFDSTKVGQTGYPRRNLEVVDLYFLQSYLPIDYDDEKDWMVFTSTLQNYCSHELCIH
jgi:hypothetical protein